MSSLKLVVMVSILIPLGRSFSIWWRNWSDAYPRKMVSRVFGLLFEFAQYHARSRCGCCIFDASGEI